METNNCQNLSCVPFHVLYPGIPGGSIHVLHPGIPGGSIHVLYPGIPGGSIHVLYPGTPGGSYHVLYPGIPGGSYTYVVYPGNPGGFIHVINPGIPFHVLYPIQEFLEDRNERKLSREGRRQARHTSINDEDDLGRIITTYK